VVVVELACRLKPGFLSSTPLTNLLKITGMSKKHPIHRPQKPAICPICRGMAPWIFRHQVLLSALADMHLCSKCEYLFAAQPRWLSKAYARVINAMDTGCLARAVDLRNQTALPIFLISGGREPWLDYGAGHGVYVRLMRDIGFDFYWNDPLAENLFANGFEEPDGKKFAGVTCFECLEHFTDPLGEMKKMTSRAPWILFSTELRSESVPNPEAWLYYGWEHGQHVGFHSLKSLGVLAETLGLKLVSSGGWLHAFLPAREAESLSARLIRDGRLSLAAWRRGEMQKLFRASTWLRSLGRGKIVPRDFVDAIPRFLGSKTWQDHLKIKKTKKYPPR